MSTEEGCGHRVLFLTRLLLSYNTSNCKLLWTLCCSMELAYSPWQPKSTQRQEGASLEPVLLPAWCQKRPDNALCHSNGLASLVSEQGIVKGVKGVAFCTSFKARLRWVDHQQTALGSLVGEEAHRRSEYRLAVRSPTSCWLLSVKGSPRWKLPQAV